LLAGMGDLITFDLSGIELAAGSYWIGITPFNGFAANGQTGVATSFEGDLGAVPAPGALALLGLAGIASRRRRK